MTTTMAPSRLQRARHGLPTLGVRQSTGRREERRGSAHERGYGARWRAVRETELRVHPLCVCCKANGRIMAATVVDHVQPHRGDMALFWDPANRQCLCKGCHDGIKATIEAQWEAGKVPAAWLRLDRLMPDAFPT